MIHRIMDNAELTFEPLTEIVESMESITLMVGTPHCRYQHRRNATAYIYLYT